jgi:hypothetical protein
LCERNFSGISCAVEKLIPHKRKTKRIIFFFN